MLRLRQMLPRVVWANPEKAIALILVVICAVVFVINKVHVDFQMEENKLEGTKERATGDNRAVDNRGFGNRPVRDKIQVIMTDKNSAFHGQQITLDLHDASTDEDTGTFHQLEDENDDENTQSQLDVDEKEGKKGPPKNVNVQPNPPPRNQNIVNMNQNSKKDNEERKDTAANKYQKPWPETSLNIAARETTKKLAPGFLQPGPNHEYLNLLDMKPPEYLPKYKNPCWIETIDTPEPYNQCQFRDMENYNITFEELEAIWKSKLENGQNWRIRCLPYFYIAGMAKCGTSELYTRLRLHPDVTRGPMKETHYWTRWRVGWMPRGYVPIRNFVDMFDKAAIDIQKKVVQKNGQDYHPMIFGDGSVSTLYENDWFPDLPENSGDKKVPTWLIPHYLYHIYNQTRILAILRDPVERLYSDYLFFQSPEEKTPENFHQFAIESTSLMTECIDKFSLEQCIYNGTFKKQMTLHVREGIYAPFVRSYLDIFPKNQVMIIKLEDYSKDRLGSLNDVLDFLDLEKMPDKEADKIEEAPSRNHRSDDMAELGPMLDDTRKLLKSFYKPFNQDLARLMGDKRFLWDTS